MMRARFTRSVDIMFAMRPDDLLQLLRQRPFVPFRLHLSNGRVFEIRHPDQAIVMRSRVVIGAGSGDDLPDHLEHVALVHIVQIEELPAAREAG